MAAKAKGRFIDPMLLLRTDSLPNDGDRWEYQLKFDGYRAIAFKTGGKIHLRSRNDNDFSVRYSNVVKGLAKLPDETVIDGEVIALDEDGRPSFNILQNYGSSKAPVLYFVFDVMVLAGRDVMREPLEIRRELLEKRSSEAERTGSIRRASGCEFAGAHRVREGAGTRRPGRQAPRQPVRSRSAVWCLAENACQPRAGVRDWRLHGRDEDVRRARLRILRRRPSHLRRTHPKRIHAGRAGAAVQEIPRAGNQGLPVRESSRSEERPMGCGPDGSEDEGLSVAEAGAGRADRVPGMDRRESPAAHQVHCAARRQTGTRG